MIEKELENIVKEQRKNGLQDATIRNVLKEYLQVYVLYFIYTSPKYRQKLIFTGGTCLRHFYGLERLSEDIDFDSIGDVSPHDLCVDLKNFFEVKYQYPNVRIALKQRGHQIRLQFPVLKKLGMAGNNDSDLLYVKLDLSPLPSKNYSAVTTSKSSFGFNYAARHYDLSDLMAGKLHAILMRSRRTGREGRDTIKGRDYFDLLWFVKKGVRPNRRRLSDMLKLSEEIPVKDLEKRVDQKVTTFVREHKRDYVDDMQPLTKDPDVLKIYTENYMEEYLRFKAQSFSKRIQLRFICRKCNKEFATGISLEKEAFENLLLGTNIHQCPFCHHENTVSKPDYLTRET